MTGALDRLPAEARKQLRRVPQPDFVAPMLATLTDERFSREGWIFERKVDGERSLCFRRGGRGRLMSRNRKTLNSTYPELVDALAAQQAEDFVVDGENRRVRRQRDEFREAPAADAAAHGRAGAGKRRRRLLVRLRPALPGRLRHQAARAASPEAAPAGRTLVQYSTPLHAHRARDGEAAYREACERGWEGLIAKRADAPYRSGRSTDWLKFKCVNEQEFVIGGYTEPGGRRVGFGALLVGYYDRGRLAYAGKVGTGYDNETLRSLGRRLAALERDEPLFEQDGLPRGRVHWVKPELVAQIAFTEVTRDGKLRHPRFRGLRRDKRPRDVVLEQPR